MDFDAIINILKGDYVGHNFHGNQWLNLNGQFDPNAQGGIRPRRGGGAQPKPARARKPVAVRQPKPAPAPTPVQQSPVTPHVEAPKQDVKLDGIGTGKQYLGPSSKNITKVDEDLSNLGGAQQKSMQLVTLDDGSKAIVKTIGRWGSQSGADLAENEVLASKIGEAMDIPIRGAVMKDGTKDTIIQPFINGQRWGRLSDVNDSPGDTRVSKLPTEWVEPMGEVKLFDQLSGNPDRHAGNLMVSGVPSDFRGTMQEAANMGATIVGIDHSLCFTYGPSNFGLQNIVNNYGIPPERLSQMASGLTTLQSSGALSSLEQGKVDNIVEAFNRVFPEAFK
jgi:hypothetical protein